MQPVAVHRVHAERLLLTDDDARWFLWMGEEGVEPIEIPRRLAQYLRGHAEMCPLEAGQRMWFVVADLPIREPLSPSVDLAEREFTL
jgi:hypothetical protein